jgi:protein-tyrosine phosphatase
LLPAPEDAFFILTVCTGNVCRSPAVERLLGSQLGPSVSSAGTHALVGHPIAEPMAALLHQAGAEAKPFQARRLSEQMLKDADLILPMTRVQRGLIVELWPRAVRRTFTLREFARLLTQVDPLALSQGTTPGDRLHTAIRLAAAERGRWRTSPDEDDVVDPFRLSAELYAESFAQINSAVEQIVIRLL